MWLFFFINGRCRKKRNTFQRTPLTPKQGRPAGNMNQGTMKQREYPERYWYHKLHQLGLIHYQDIRQNKFKVNVNWAIMITRGPGKDQCLAQELEPRTLVLIIDSTAPPSYMYILIWLFTCRILCQLTISSWPSIPVSITWVKFTGVNTPIHWSHLYPTDGSIPATLNYKQLALLKRTPRLYPKRQGKILKQAMDHNLREKSQTLWL